MCLVSVISEGRPLHSSLFTDTRFNFQLSLQLDLINTGKKKEQEAGDRRVSFGSNSAVADKQWERENWVFL